MKLRNKSTDEIRKAEAREDGIYLWDILTKRWYKYGLEVLARYWEYYVEPKEPLIKDEKIRKAVRAWAGLYDSGVVRAHIGEDYVSLFKDEVNGYSSSVGIDLPPDVFVELIDTHYYTIKQLCGEGEE